ncbi:hypothetical protein SADUNF_Sadunf06G0086300 [Salix dunnii]|uniref:Uncharacterized protein n=1 Tax=Salix dunnii TaxID=1413687 RepID=A0A835K3T1_9ROSI|nr:hypothetical protein SADUNF_Sadunf06G0086300 [Salix dunnii]
MSAETKLLLPRQMASFSMVVMKGSNGSKAPLDSSATTQSEIREGLQQSSGVVEAIIPEVKDRKRIGGDFWKTDARCCSSTLAEMVSCRLREVILQKKPDISG